MAVFPRSGVVATGVPSLATLPKCGVLIFGVYGTLIDREQGLAEAWRMILPERSAQYDLDALTARLAMHERSLQSGPYRTYRDILAQSLRLTMHELSISPGCDQVYEFTDSVSVWPAFTDAADALAKLKPYFRLAVITNCDDESFAMSSKRLGTEFDYIVTAEQARSYKPSLNNFHFALGQMGERPENVMHIGHSLTLDIAPARRLGIASVWIDRTRVSVTSGNRVQALDPSFAPDARYFDLRTFSQAMIDLHYEN